MPRGGARPGAGRRVGYKEKGTLEKEEARALLRKLVFARMGPLVESQLANAEGLKYLVYRDKGSGKFVTVKSDELEAAQIKNTVEVWEKDPNVGAFTDLLNRAMDKPTEHVEMQATVTGSVVLARLSEGRKRIANAKRSD